MRCNQFYTARKPSTDLEKSRDLVQTRGFTFGDNVTHFCDSFQCGRMLRTVAQLFLLVSSISVHGSGMVDFFHLCTLSFVLKHSVLARSVFVLHGHRLCRDIVVVLIASISIWIPDFSFFSETGNWRSAGLEIRSISYHWQRSNGSVSFTMSSACQNGYFFIPRWNEEAATLESFDQREKLFVSSTKEERHLCGPRLRPRGRHISLRSTQPD